jgi:hypothetical protein
MPDRAIPSLWKPLVVVHLSQAVLAAVAQCLLTAGPDTALISWVSGQSLFPFPSSMYMRKSRKVTLIFFLLTEYVQRGLKTLGHFST